MAAVLLVLLFIQAVALGGESPTPGGTLRVASQRDLSLLNPFVNTRSFDHNLRALIYESVFTDTDYKAVANLAESWQISKDGREYTFNLRKGVVFHNGRQMTSEDIRWDLEYTTNPKNRAYGRANLPEITATETPDPHTVRVRIKEPFAPFLAALTSLQSFPVIPRGSMEVGEQPKSFPPGTGPYRFDEWQRGHRIVLKKNVNYWKKGLPLIDTIVFQPVPDDEVRFAALRSGDVDLAERIANHHVDQIRKGKHKDLQIALAEGASLKGVVFNVQVPPFNDVRLRQALASAIDKEEIIQAAYWGLGTLVSQKERPSSPWYFDVPERKRDLEKARALMKQAGYSDGLKTNMLVYQGTEKDVQVIQRQLKEIGVELDIRITQLSTMLEALRKGEFTFAMFGGDIPIDPDPNYYASFHTEAVRNRNLGGYSNPKVDALLERGRVTMDPQERRKNYTEVVRILNDDLPVIWYAIGPYAFVFHSHVKGFRSDSEGRFYSGDTGFPYAWIKK
jgi:peptide/nickel transport system substrate-binding protein